MPASKYHRDTIELNTALCDMNSDWRLSSILTAMQEAGAGHCQELGVGRLHLLEKGLVWIIARVAIEIDRYPKLGETVTVETYPTPARRWFMPRWYRVWDEAGNEVLRGGALWCLLDLSTRHMAPPDAVTPNMPDNSDLKPCMPYPGNVSPLDAPAEARLLQPTYTDLDANRHVNNTRYADWCCNALGLETLDAFEIRRFAVNYEAEIRPGQQIRTELRREGSEFTFSGLEGDSRHFDIGGTLVPRS